MSTDQRSTAIATGGSGESVVSGQVTPDYWAVDRASGRIGEQRVGGKHVLQHRPETTWPAALAAVPAPSPAANAQPEPAAKPSFAPVQYALRNVFMVPGA